MLLLSTSQGLASALNIAGGSVQNDASRMNMNRIALHNEMAKAQFRLQSALDNPSLPNDVRKAEIDKQVTRIRTIQKDIEGL